MLYDDIISANEGSCPDPVMRDGISRFGAVLKDIPKYILTEPIVQMVETLSSKRPTALLHGLPICFLPFPKIWVECLYNDFLQALERVQGEGAIGKLRHVEGCDNPHRIGFLFEEETEHGTIAVTMAWSHKNINIKGMFFKSIVNLCVLGWNIYTKSDNNTPFKECAELQPTTKQSDYLHAFRHSKQDVESYIKLTERMLCGVSEYSQSYYNRNYAFLKATNPAGLDLFYTQMQHDIAGEWRHSLAILMVLNSKTCVEISEVCKRRKPIHGKPANTYREVRFRLSRVQRNTYLASGKKLEDLVKHLVSAHLKVRKTGVFLWSSHVRGYKGEASPPVRTVVP
jgi:hypothetical protein